MINIVHYGFIVISNDVYVDRYIVELLSENKTKVIFNKADYLMWSAILLKLDFICTGIKTSHS